MNNPAPPRFHLMAKPTGAICNLACSYCFFLDKELLYPGSPFRMSDEVLENYIRQLIEAHRTPQVTVAWQGGEPTLMGLDFYTHIDHPMKMMVSLMRAGRPASEVMSILDREAAELKAAIAKAGRNAPCPCGSGLKTKQCHGRKRAVTAPQSIKLPVHKAQPRARVVAVSE